MTPNTYHLRGRVLPSSELKDLFVVDGKITFEEQPSSESIVEEGWIVPGLVDAHAHLALASPSDANSSHDLVRASARAHLDVGVLLIREPGGPDHASSDISIDEELPRVQSAGRFLAPPGGYFPGLAREVPASQLPQAVSEEAKAGRGWAKIIGDSYGPMSQIVAHWDRDTLRSAAEAAHKEGARITIHTGLPSVIEDAIMAGFDCIEHGTGMTPELVSALVEHAVAWCPTMTINSEVQNIYSSDAGSGKEVHGWVESQPALVAAAFDQGVRVLAGTDAGLVPHGIVWREVANFLAAGVRPDLALGAASWDARSYLGHPGLEDGAPADLVVFGDDPRLDAESLLKPKLIMLEGRLLKRP